MSKYKATDTIITLGKISYIILFKVIKRLNGATLIKANPVTGRTHQIRVHCQYAGFPIVGDPKYSLDFNKSDLKNIKNLCLHAAKIGLKDPSSETLIEVDAPIDSHFKSMLEIKSL